MDQNLKTNRGDSDNYWFRKGYAAAIADMKKNLELMAAKRSNAKQEAQ